MLPKICSLPLGSGRVRLHQKCTWPLFPGPFFPYTRHRPEQTLLYWLVEEHFPAFAEQMVAQEAVLNNPRVTSLGGRYRNLRGLRRGGIATAIRSRIA